MHPRRKSPKTHGQSFRLWWYFYITSPHFVVLRRLLFHLFHLSTRIIICCVSCILSPCFPPPISSSSVTSAMPEDNTTNINIFFNVAAATVSQATFIASIAAHLLLPDNEDETSNQIIQRHGGSSIGRLPNLNRDTYYGHCRLMFDYFAPVPVYPPIIFRRRFRMQKELFTRIVEKLGENNVYFTQRTDALGIYFLLVFISFPYLVYVCT